jgi:hypothetical protein
VGAEDVVHKRCEDCKVERSRFGLPAEETKRWCSGCAKAHAGAVDVGTKKCEGCGLKQPSFGLPSEGKQRWCVGCAPRAARRLRPGRGALGGRRRRAGGRGREAAGPPSNADR